MTSHAFEGPPEAGPDGPATATIQVAVKILKRYLGHSSVS